ncbi:MAG: hypothetical protein M1840_004396 [Geoglossum simile]|nr:MAG: hypothetical protein M1840_004396 [Geoglossum simile]
MSASSSRRGSTAAAGPDHQIILLNNSHLLAECQAQPDTVSSIDLSTTATSATTTTPTATAPLSPIVSSRRGSDAFLGRKWSLREELTRRKYSKWQESRFVVDVGGDRAMVDDLNTDNTQTEAAGLSQGIDQARGYRVDGLAPATVRKGGDDRSEPYEIDILYENQRGAFLCGIPLFSHKSLLNLDPSPWVNSDLRESPVDIMNAQVPDPSWQWSWKSWYVDMSSDVDEEGWQYSFSFSPAFPWHGTHVWFHSFVRRRRWLRKRVRRYSRHDPNEDGLGIAEKDSHTVNPDYFSINYRREGIGGSEAESIGIGTESRRSNIGTTGPNLEDMNDIQDIASLMRVLKKARIDREKIEAVERFLEQGGEEVFYLSDRMAEIMASFVFQASRRQLLAHLSRKFDAASSHRCQHLERGEPKGDEEEGQIDYLLKAVRTADEQVQQLEFWSDVKAMAAEGESVGGRGEGQGWGCKWGASGLAGPLVSVANAGRRGWELQGQEMPDKGKGKA